MFFPLWPPVAIIALLMILVIMVILIYGDRICARVKTQTDRITVRARPSLEPMIRMGTVTDGHGQHRYSPEQQQRYHQPPSQQQYQIQQQQPGPYVQQPQHRYDSPPIEIPQPTTYGREIEV